jgi:hypothetical protein
MLASFYNAFPGGFMKKIAILLLIFSVLASSCMTNRHEIGEGAQLGVKKQETQWYLLWGLVPLGNVDTKKLAGNSNDYEITTTYGFLDVLANILLGPFSFQTRTVTVIR